MSNKQLLWKEKKYLIQYEWQESGRKPYCNLRKFPTYKKQGKNCVHLSYECAYLQKYPGIFGTVIPWL